MSAPTQTDAQRARLARSPAGRADVRLFTGCDPRGVLTRALAVDAAPWSTRPDALVFGWMLALAPGIDSRKAAASVIAVAQSDPDRTWTDAQVALLEQIRSVMTTEPG